LATNKKNFEKALTLTEQLVRIYPERAGSYDAQGWVLFLKGDYIKANEVIDNGIAKDKNGSESIFEHKGDILFKLGQTEPAVGFWKRALELNKSNKKLENKIKERTIIE
jgi:tetratricopeptide (TPR) repeat protein